MKIDFENGLVVIDLFSDNYDKTIEFYTKFLDFNVLIDIPVLSGRLVYLEHKNNTKFRLSLVSEKENKAGKLFNINLSKTEILHTKIENSGWGTVSKLINLPYKQYFEFTDPSGNSFFISETFTDSIDWDN